MPTNAPVIDPNEAEKATAFAFLKVIVGNAAKGKASFDDAKLAVAVALGQYPTVKKFFKADSAETVALINETLGASPWPPTLRQQPWIWHRCRLSAQSRAGLKLCPLK